MSATYTQGSLAPISRVRFDVPDTNTSAAKFTDEEYYRWLDEALSFEALVLRLSTTNTAGATAATAEILLDGTEIDLAIVRTLPGGPDTQTVDLTPKTPKHRLRHVVDAVRKLDIEIAIGLAQGSEVEWIDETSDGWLGGVSPLGRKVARLANGGDLALTRNGPLNIFGDSEPDIVAGEDLGFFPFYVYDSVVAEALRLLAAGGGAPGAVAASMTYIERKESRISWKKAKSSIEGRIAELDARAAAFGIFARAS